MSDHRLGNGADYFEIFQPDGYSSARRIYGENGNDTILMVQKPFWIAAYSVLADGCRGDDYIALDGSGNTLLGGPGDDTLRAGTFSFFGEIGFGNILDGGSGDDLLVSRSSALYRPAFFDGGLGNSLTGGRGTDTFDVRTVSDLYVVNDANGAGQGVVSEGDQIFGLFDLITDYEPGETLLINAAVPAAGPVQLGGPQHNTFLYGIHAHLVLADGEYAAFRGTYEGGSAFLVDAGGSDLLVAADVSDGRDDAIQSSVVLQNVTSLDAVLIG